MTAVPLSSISERWSGDSRASRRVATTAHSAQRGRWKTGRVHDGRARRAERQLGFRALNPDEVARILDPEFEPDAAIAEHVGELVDSVFRVRFDPRALQTLMAGVRIARCFRSRWPDAVDAVDELLNVRILATCRGLQNFVSRRKVERSVERA